MSKSLAGLILSSQGLTTEEIQKSTELLMGKSLSKCNVAIINEAYTSAKDHRWLVNELSNIGTIIGGCISILDFSTLPICEIRNRIESSDLIYILGGKIWSLTQNFHRKNIGILLKDYLPSKIVIGSSSGAIILGMEQPFAYLYARYNNNADKVINSEFMRLFPFSLIPHYKRIDHPKINDQFLDFYLHDSNFPIYALQDNQAIVYDGTIRFCGGSPVAFGNANL